MAAALVLATIGFFVIRGALRHPPSSTESTVEHTPSTATPEVSAAPAPAVPSVPESEPATTEADQRAREQREAAARHAAQRLDVALRLLDRAKLTEQPTDFLAARAALSPLAAPLKGSPYEPTLAAALTRAFARSGAQTLGNFWVDLTRTVLYVLLPLSILLALAFVLAGIPQTLSGAVEATTLEGAKQTIALGPIAGQEAIKQLGTNGGGFFNANAAHPYESPNAITNLIHMVSIFAIGAGLTGVFGRIVGKRRQGWAIFAVMGILFVAGVAVCYWAEASGTTGLNARGYKNSTLLFNLARVFIARSPTRAVINPAWTGIAEPMWEPVQIRHRSAYYDAFFIEALLSYCESGLSSSAEETNARRAIAAMVRSTMAPACSTPRRDCTDCTAALPAVE